MTQNRPCLYPAVKARSGGVASPLHALRRHHRVAETHCQLPGRILRSPGPTFSHGVTEGNRISVAHLSSIWPACVTKLSKIHASQQVIVQPARSSAELLEGPRQSAKRLASCSRRRLKFVSEIRRPNASPRAAQGNLSGLEDEAYRCARLSEHEGIRVGFASILQ